MSVGCWLGKPCVAVYGTQGSNRNRCGSRRDYQCHDATIIHCGAHEQQHSQRVRAANKSDPTSDGGDTMRRGFLAIIAQDSENTSFAAVLERLQVNFIRSDEDGCALSVIPLTKAPTSGQRSDQHCLAAYHRRPGCDSR